PVRYRLCRARAGRTRDATGEQHLGAPAIDNRVLIQLPAFAPNSILHRGHEADAPQPRWYGIDRQAEEEAGARSHGQHWVLGRSEADPRSAYALLPGEPSSHLSHLDDWRRLPRVRLQVPLDGNGVHRVLLRAGTVHRAVLHAHDPSHRTDGNDHRLVAERYEHCRRRRVAAIGVIWYAPRPIGARRSSPRDDLPDLAAVPKDRPLPPAGHDGRKHPTSGGVTEAERAAGGHQPDLVVGIGGAARVPSLSPPRARPP